MYSIVCDRVIFNRGLYNSWAQNDINKTFNRKCILNNSTVVNFSVVSLCNSKDRFV